MCRAWLYLSFSGRPLPPPPCSPPTFRPAALLGGLVSAFSIKTSLLPSFLEGGHPVPSALQAAEKWLLACGDLSGRAVWLPSALPSAAETALGFLFSQRKRPLTIFLKLKKKKI